VTAVLVLVTGSAGSDPIPTARSGSVARSAAVGVIFLDGVGDTHDCTASVIRSPAGDVVLTAAHCLSGTGQGITFVPGYDAGAAPFGVWNVTGTYVDPRWISTQDPQHDYAFLVVAPEQRDGRRVRLGDVVAGNPLGAAPQPGQQVQVNTYPDTAAAGPISCTTAAYTFAGYPAFDCDGYASGSSGAPLLTRTSAGMVTSGIIGGLQQGGCFDYTSYSPRFDTDTVAVYERASRSEQPDTLPVTRDNDC